MGGSSSTDNPNGFFPSINSYDGKVMLAAIISLLIVISFVLLLHFYMRWYLRQAQQRRRSQSASTLYVFDNPARLHYHVRSRTPTDDFSQADGLDASVIASLPLFAHKSDDYKSGLECVICLTAFEDDEQGRLLPKCNHSFHVECIDMWLHSHSKCPICRTSVKPEKPMDSIIVTAEEGSQDLVSGQDSLNINMASNPSQASIQIGPSPNLDITVFKDPSILSPSSSSSSSSSPSSSLGCSLKRMLSRSRSEHKVFLSSNINELSA